MIYRPDINPISFHQRVTWDYNTNFPTSKNLPSTVSGRNIKPIQFIQKWATNTPIVFELNQDRNDNVEVYIYENNARSIITGVDVTPSGWAGLGNYVFLYTYIPLTKDTFKISITEEVTVGNLEYYDSPRIEVYTSLKGYAKIQYAKSDNLSNTVFISDEGETIFEPTLFLECSSTKLLGGEYSISPSPAGVIRKLRSATTSGIRLVTGNISDNVVDQLGLIFGCPYISVNDIKYQSEEVPEPTPTQGSNSNTLSVELWRSEWNYVNDYNPFETINPTSALINNGNFLINNGEYLINTTT